MMLSPMNTLIDLRDPDLTGLTIEHVAHSLSHLARFNGYTKTPYSVAEHSVWCSLIVPKEYQLAALMHDMAEVFTGDIVKHVKDLIGEPIKALEHTIESAMCEHFHMDQALLHSEPVKRADSTLCALELWQHLGYSAPGSAIRSMDLGKPLPAPEAKRMFLKRWRELVI